MVKEFMENKDGVHLMGVDGEHGLCGDAFDIGSEEGEGTMLPTLKTLVTCDGCWEVIRLCQQYCREARP